MSSVCCNTCFNPLDVTVITGECLCLPVGHPHRSEPPDVASHLTSAGSGSPPHTSGSRGLRDRSPLLMTLACPYDSAGSSSVDQLQRGQRYRGRKEGKTEGLGSDAMSCYVRLHNTWAHYFTSMMQMILFKKLLDKCSEQTFVLVKSRPTDRQSCI